MNFSPLLCKIQRYAWGSRSFIASLQGRPTPSDEPEAELWVGAHPSAPAEVVEGETQSRLDVLIARAPERALGTDVARRFHDELPFLMKVLAAAEPLSLQAHPSRAQAEQGFAQEQAAGIRLDAPTRSYKDARPKPELIVALTPFVALSGFRPLERTLRLIAELSIPELTGLFGPLHAGTGLAADGAEARLARVFDRLINSEAAERHSLVRSVRVRAAELAPQSKEFARELRWVERLYTLYPGDIGVVISLLLNHVELAPFQGLYLPPGNLHAYLDGAGVEIMANSDNVLRGGLTKKAVNVSELLRILRFEELELTPLLPDRVRASSSASTNEFVYQTPADEFELSYFHVAGNEPLPRSRGPELLLVIEGQVGVRSASANELCSLAAGSAAFIPASEGPLTMEGRGVVFRAKVPGD